MNPTREPLDVLYLMKQEMLRRGMSIRTIDTYIQCVRQFLQWSNKDTRCITSKDVKDYIDTFVDKNAPGNTINVHLNALKFLVEEVLNKRIMWRIRYSKVPKKLPDYLNKDEVVKLFSAIKNTKHLLLVKLMYSAGLRVSETINLKVQDFDFENKLLFIRNGKGRKDRLCMIANELLLPLKEWISTSGLNPEDYLFGGQNGHLTSRTVQEILKSASKDAKIRKVHPHMLRHSFATHLISNGCDVVSCQSLLGHASSETTMRYVHVASPTLIAVKSPLDTL